MLAKRKFVVFILLLEYLVAQAVNHVDELWQMSTTGYHKPYIGAPMANGGIGILPWKEPFSVKHVILNHVFDNSRDVTGVTRVLKGVNPFLLELQLDGAKVDSTNISNWSQSIDMKQAIHITRFVVNRKAEVTYRICALRNMPYCGLIDIQIKALKQLDVKVSNYMEIPSDDYASFLTRYRTQFDGDIRLDVLQTNALSMNGKQQVSASSVFVTPDALIPVYDQHKQQAYIERKLNKNEVYSFALVGAICSTRDFIDPINESEREVIHALQLGTEHLLAKHYALWNELWKGNIYIEGDDEAQRVVRFALFNLYSFGREGSGLSISPMGLSSQGYNGHVFWDSEVWMYPPLLLLNKGIAKSMLDYRLTRLEAAKKKAFSYGYQGAMFPWESDDAGEEATPTFALCGSFEHHITADIAIACWNYYCVTQDVNWLRTDAYPLLESVADFWVSRCSQNEDGSFSILNVVGPDEYAIGVDDNAFTNAAASCVFDIACRAADLCGKVPNVNWKHMKDKLRIPTFSNGVIREHADYNGEMIKQADVNLLGYPLGYITDITALKQNLDYYAQKIDRKNGPAMSFSIFCVQYARLGEADKAYEAFLRSYQPNWRVPFGVLAETAVSNNPYFATGAGGLLQAVINGFCGLQITSKGVIQVPSVMPKHWKKLIVTGVGVDRQTFVREQ